MIKKYWRRLSIFLFLLLFRWGVFPPTYGQPTIPWTSNVPQEYYANYLIDEQRSQLLNVIIDLKAAKDTWSEVPASLFQELHAIFLVIFDFFPQDPNSQLVYRKCLLITDQLKNEVTRNGYTKFNEQCFSSLDTLINKIQSDFTIQPKISANPTKWSAPLTVTFDARATLDPSWQTIPSENFFRRYKNPNNVDIAIWQWEIITYTFPESGNQVVHLTVRSANNLSQGIFDGEENININVWAKAAEINVYANGKQLTTDNILRIGAQAASDPILIDGTAITPLWTREILEYEWIIIWNEDNYSFKKSGKGDPWQFEHIFPRNGTYTIQINIIDNENNRMQEKYDIAISDPVAIIKKTPDEWNTSTTFSFDASASYAIQSRLASYTWEITDPKGEKIDTVESKKLKRSFKQPGNYTAKLTVTDEQKTSSYDTQSFYVASTAPVPAFNITSATDLRYPSSFELDASASFDEDVLAGNDKLSYEWSRTPNEWVIMEPISENMQKIWLTFNNPATYIIKLTVKDSFGELAEAEKKIEVISTLRPDITVSPDVSHWWEEITFNATSNLPIDFYTWDFGNGKKQDTNSTSVTHTYTSAWVYKATLTATARDGTSNTITRQVFMWQKDLPIPAYEIRGNKWVLLQAESSCDIWSWNTVPAFMVDRYEMINISAQNSLNAQGKKTDITVSLQPQNDEVYQKSNLSYEFPEVWCTYIDVFVDDTNTGKSNTEKIRFDVQNAKPTLTNLLLSFPQAIQAAPVGVGLTTTNSNQQIDVFASGIDPIVVQLATQWSKDPDWFISYYARYYYESSNPDNILSLKVTPADIPYATFVIPKPRQAREYVFGVRIIDNEWAETESKDIIGIWPIVFFPPWKDTLDVPRVSLKSDKTQLKVGDKVRFTTTSSILSKKPDFDETKYFKYDFDGDGEYDLTTKQDSVDHYYQKPGTFSPKVAVFYRGRAGIAVSEKITIQKSLKPVILFDSYDRHVLIKDTSYGDIDTRTLCMDIRACRQQPERIFKDEPLIHFSYNKLADYFLQLDLIDLHGNTAAKREKISLHPWSWNIGILSLPQARTTQENKQQISVGENLDNEVVFYIVYDENDTCFMDSDITQDSDLDGDPTNDEDAICNQIVPIRFTPYAQTQTVRIYYGEQQQSLFTTQSVQASLSWSSWVTWTNALINDNKKSSINTWSISIKQNILTWENEQDITEETEPKAWFKDIEIYFLDYEFVIAEEYQQSYDILTRLIQDVPRNSTDEITRFYKDLLVNLQKSLWETDEMNSLIVQIRDILQSTENIVSSDHEKEMLQLLDTLQDDALDSIYLDGVYEQAKNNILARFTEDKAQQASEAFALFEQNLGDQTSMLEHLTKVFRLSAQARDEGDIDATDYTYIQANICDIVVYYDIPSKTCGTQAQDTLDNQWWDNAEQENISPWWNDTKPSWSRLRNNILRIIIIVVGILVLVFGVLVVLFAIKAKRQRDMEDEDFEPEPEQTDEVDIDLWWENETNT